MSGNLKKVQSGDPLRIPAATFNTFIDAARDFQQRTRQMSQRDRPSARHSGIIHVRNDSGADRDRFDVLGISGAVFPPSSDVEAFKNHPAVTGVTPAEADHRGAFVVLLEPVAAGNIGLAMAAGVVPVQISVTDENHRFADVNDGVATHLESGPFGSARILYKPAGTGTLWCLVRLGDSCGEGTHESPAELAGSGAAADTDTWDIDDPPAGTDGVEFTPFRLYWSGDSGDPVYQFVRTPTYDSAGRLVAVSAEARSAAFDTDTCEDA